VGVFHTTVLRLNGVNHQRRSNSLQQKYMVYNAHWECERTFNVQRSMLECNELAFYNQIFYGFFNIPVILGTGDNMVCMVFSNVHETTQRD
jgi:hypothetical protein